MSTVYQATVPGSCMLFGEYSVLENYPAIVAAMNQFMQITLKPRTDQLIHIRSQLGEMLAPLEQFPADPPFQFIAKAISVANPTSGFTLTITSEFSDQVGLGSSAAVTVGTLACLYRSLNRSFTFTELLCDARSIIQAVQGVGSGADVAASIFGGLITYEKDKNHIERLPLPLPIHLIYSGYKTPTPVAVAQVIKNFEGAEDALSELLESISVCTEMAAVAIIQQRLPKIGKLMQLQHAYMMKLGVLTDELLDLVNHVAKEPGIFGVKLSGSGLGDCLVALGDLPQNTYPKTVAQKNAGIYQLNASMTERGLELAEWTE